MERGAGRGKGARPTMLAVLGASLGAAFLLAQAQAGSGVSADWAYAPDPPGTLSSVIVQPGGEGGDFLYLLGQRRMDDGRDYPYVARVDPDGDLIALSGPKKAGDEAVLDVAFPGGGKTILAGSFTKFSGKVRRGVARLDSAGKLDEGYAAPPPFGSATTGSDAAGSAAPSATSSAADWGADGPVLKIVPAADGRLLCYGTFSRWSGGERRGLALLGPAGQLDAAFDPGRSLENAAGPVLLRSMRALKDGRFLLSGDFDRYDGFALPCKGIALIKADGSFDKSLALPYDSASCLASREATAQAVLLLCAKKDVAFSLVETDLSGKPLAGGIFAPLPSEALSAVYLSDGSVVLGLGFERKKGDPALAGASLLARVSGSSVDAGFGAALSFYAEGERGGILSMALLRDGSLVAGGSFALGEEGRALRNLARILF